MSESSINLADLGLRSPLHSQIGLEQAQRLAATIDAPQIGDGDPLPLLWHWAFFTPDVATCRLGPDGHPCFPAGGVMDGLSRRMSAGGRIRQEDDLLVGRPATRTSTVTGCVRKQSRRGPLLVVTLEHRVHQDGRLVLREEQDLVYLPSRRPDEPTTAPAGDHRPASPPDGWLERCAVDAITLFRFSAVTFNSHRIHYDPGYAASVEGYPGLVVHGPLTALLAAQSTAAHLGRPLRRIDFRATNPLFQGMPFTICGVPDGGVADVRVVRSDGAIAMTATVALGEGP